MKPSIVSNDERCLICGARVDLQRHHAMHGVANRRKADEDGLWVYLCRKCHMDLHDHGAEDMWVMKEAQRAWEKYYSKNHDDFRQRYGKSLL